jgi:hypothetical protein
MWKKVLITGDLNKIKALGKILIPDASVIKYAYDFELNVEIIKILRELNKTVILTCDRTILKNEIIAPSHKLYEIESELDTEIANIQRESNKISNLIRGETFFENQIGSLSYNLHETENLTRGETFFENQIGSSSCNLHEIDFNIDFDDEIIKIICNSNETTSLTHDSHKEESNAEIIKIICDLDDTSNLKRTSILTYYKTILEKEIAKLNNLSDDY